MLHINVNLTIGLIGLMTSLSFPSVCLAQDMPPHLNAHSHNDYLQPSPLKDALRAEFNSVEADVYLRDGKLLVSHDYPAVGTSQLGKLYLAPLDSIIKVNSGSVYSEYAHPFFLMIDIKTDAQATYDAIRKTVAKFPGLACDKDHCPVKIFFAGNRPLDILKDGAIGGFGIDGRPADIGKGYSTDVMPVISDQFKNWSSWRGKAAPEETDLKKIKELAASIHAEGKKLRLWAAPDNELAWGALLEAGVDLINTDRIDELSRYLTRHGL